MKKRTLSLLGVTLSLLGIFLMVGSVLGLAACLGPTGIDPDAGFKLPDKIETVDVTAAVLMLTNRSKTVDVTKVTITQPEENTVPPWAVSFDNKPKRLEKKAQYLAPSDKNYQVVIEYAFDALGGTPGGTGAQTLSIPLPLPKQIVEYIIYRNDKGVVIIDKEALDPDPGDTGNPAIDPLPGEGSSPAVIPPDARNKMATFVVISKTNSQNIDNVNFIMGDKSYTMYGIHARDRQSIALGQGSWETRLTYTRESVDKTLGPVNSIIVPSNDPQAVQEHYLYFYLNKREDYAISQTWPPFPNDVMEEDMMPPDNGHGRGLIKIINNSYGIVEMVSVQNLKEAGKFPLSMDYGMFVPSVPIQYNKTGYVDIIGTSEFPIEAHADYLVQARVETTDGHAFVERKAYLKDQVVTITIAADDINIANLQGAKFILENATSDWPVKIIAMVVRNKANAWQSSYFGPNTWSPKKDIEPKENGEQLVLSTSAMPISARAEFTTFITLHGGGVSTTIQKPISPAILYSDTTPPDMDIRNIRITDSDVPEAIKDAFRGVNVTLQNRITSYPVDIINMTVVNRSHPTQQTVYGATSWTPHGSIANNKEALQRITGTTAMPINIGNEFYAIITVHSGGVTGIIHKDFTPPVLYSTLPAEQNTRTITINNGDVPSSIVDSIRGNGATIIMKNEVKANWPIQITSIELHSKTGKLESVTYGYSTFEPIGMIINGREAKQTVISSDDFTMAPGIGYEAEIQVLGYQSKSARIIKQLGREELYSDKAPDQNTRTIVIEDTDIISELQTPVPVKPDPSANGATVTLKNSTVDWPVDIIGMRVQNKTSASESTYYGYNEWSPKGIIEKGGIAAQTVRASTTMPIELGKRFVAKIDISYNGVTRTITKDFNPSDELYSTVPIDQNIKTVEIFDSDVPSDLRDAYTYTRGAKVTVENHVSEKWPLQITSMKVINTTNSKSTTYNSTTWNLNSSIGNGQSAIQMVRSSPAMPIKAGEVFKAELTLEGNGKTETITKGFNPSSVLFSTLEPDRNTRTITIIDSDVPNDLQTPDPKPQLPDIGGAKDGDTIVIDGIEWIKVRTYAQNKDLVLLMLKGVTGPTVQYNDTIIEYGSGPSIKGYVDTWYAALNSPILKKIAWTVSMGTTPSQTWPHNYAGETNYTTVAFIPRLADITHLMKANGYTYWLSDIYPDDTSQGGHKSLVGAIKGNGDSVNIFAKDPVYVRPCIWVTSVL